MILCAHSTSSQREQSTKRRSRSENIRKVCYSTVKITGLYDYQTWTTHFFLEIHEVRKGLWAFFLIVLSGCWLAGRADSDHVVGVVFTHILLTRKSQLVSMFFSAQQLVHSKTYYYLNACKKKQKNKKGFSNKKYILFGIGYGTSFDHRTYRMLRLDRFLKV